MAFLAAAVPAVIGAVGAGTAAVGGPVAAMTLGATALGVAGTGMQAISAARSANYNADVNIMQARQANEQGALKASEVARRTKQTQAAGRAGALQSGFDLSGSIADVLAQSQRQGDLDALAAVYDGSVAATGAVNSAKLGRQEAKNAITAGVIGMGAKALGGVSSYYGQRTRAIGT